MILVGFAMIIGLQIFMAWMQVQKDGDKQQAENHPSDELSAFSELLESSKAESHAIGMAQGIAQKRER